MRQKALEQNNHVIQQNLALTRAEALALASSRKKGLANNSMQSIKNYEEMYALQKTLKLDSNNMFKYQSQNLTPMDKTTGVDGSAGRQQEQIMQIKNAFNQFNIKEMQKVEKESLQYSQLRSKMSSGKEERVSMQQIFDIPVNAPNTTESPNMNDYASWTAHVVDTQLVSKDDRTSSRNSNLRNSTKNNNTQTLNSKQKIVSKQKIKAQNLSQKSILSQNKKIPIIGLDLGESREEYRNRITPVATDYQQATFQNYQINNSNSQKLKDSNTHSNKSYKVIAKNDLNLGAVGILMLDSYEEASRSRSEKSFNEYGKINSKSEFSLAQQNIQLINAKNFNINHINIRMSSEGKMKQQEEFSKNRSIMRKGNVMSSFPAKSPASSYESTISDHIEVKNTSNSNYGATSRRKDTARKISQRTESSNVRKVVTEEQYSNNEYPSGRTNSQDVKIRHIQLQKFPKNFKQNQETLEYQNKSQRLRNDSKIKIKKLQSTMNNENSPRDRQRRRRKDNVSITHSSKTRDNNPDTVRTANGIVSGTGTYRINHLDNPSSQKCKEGEQQANKSSHLVEYQAKVKVKAATGSQLSLKDLKSGSELKSQNQQCTLGSLDVSTSRQASLLPSDATQKPINEKLLDEAIQKQMQKLGETGPQNNQLFQQLNKMHHAIISNETRLLNERIQKQQLERKEQDLGEQFKTFDGRKKQLYIQQADTLLMDFPPQEVLYAHQGYSDLQESIRRLQKLKQEVGQGGNKTTTQIDQVIGHTIPSGIEQNEKQSMFNLWQEKLLIDQITQMNRNNEINAIGHKIEENKQQNYQLNNSIMYLKGKQQVATTVFKYPEDQEKHQKQNDESYRTEPYQSSMQNDSVIAATSRRTKTQQTKREMVKTGFNMDKIISSKHYIKTKEGNLILIPGLREQSITPKPRNSILSERKSIIGNSLNYQEHSMLNMSKDEDQVLGVSSQRAQTQMNHHLRVFLAGYEKNQSPKRKNGRALEANSKKRKKEEDKYVNELTTLTPEMVTDNPYIRFPKTSMDIRLPDKSSRLGSCELETIPGKRQSQKVQNLQKKRMENLSFPEKNNLHIKTEENRRTKSQNKQRKKPAQLNNFDLDITMESKRQIILKCSESQMAKIKKVQGEMLSNLKTIQQDDYNGGNNFPVDANSFGQAMEFVDYNVASGIVKNVLIESQHTLMQSSKSKLTGMPQKLGQKVSTKSLDKQLNEQVYKINYSKETSYGRSTRPLQSPSAQMDTPILFQTSDKQYTKLEQCLEKQKIQEDKFKEPQIIGGLVVNQKAGQQSTEPSWANLNEDTNLLQQFVQQHQKKLEFEELSKINRINNMENTQYKLQTNNVHQNKEREEETQQQMMVIHNYSNIYDTKKQQNNRFTNGINNNIVRAGGFTQGLNKQFNKEQNDHRTVGLKIDLNKIFDNIDGAKSSSKRDRSDLTNRQVSPHSMMLGNRLSQKVKNERIRNAEESTERGLDPQFQIKGFGCELEQVPDFTDDLQEFVRLQGIIDENNENILSLPITQHSSRLPQGINSSREHQAYHVTSLEMAADMQNSSAQFIKSQRSEMDVQTQQMENSRHETKINLQSKSRQKSLFNHQYKGGSVDDVIDTGILQQVSSRQQNPKPDQNINIESQPQIVSRRIKVDKISSRRKTDDESNTLIQYISQKSYIENSGLSVFGRSLTPILKSGGHQDEQISIRNETPQKGPIQAQHRGGIIVPVLNLGQIKPPCFEESNTHTNSANKSSMRRKLMMKVPEQQAEHDSNDGYGAEVCMNDNPHLGSQYEDAVNMNSCSIRSPGKQEELSKEIDDVIGNNSNMNILSNRTRENIKQQNSSRLPEQIQMIQRKSCKI